MLWFMYLNRQISSKKSSALLWQLFISRIFITMLLRLFPYFNNDSSVLIFCSAFRGDLTVITTSSRNGITNPESTCEISPSDELKYKTRTLKQKGNNNMNLHVSDCSSGIVLQTWLHEYQTFAAFDDCWRSQQNQSLERVEVHHSPQWIQPSYRGVSPHSPISTFCIWHPSTTEFPSYTGTPELKGFQNQPCTLSLKANKFKGKLVKLKKGEKHKCFWYVLKFTTII